MAEEESYDSPGYAPDELLSWETIDRWERPVPSRDDLIAACAAGSPPEGFDAQFPWHDQPQELPAFRAAAVAGYWAARCALGTAGASVATAEQTESWDERIYQVVNAMDIVGLSFEWNDDFADASQQLLDSVMTAHGINPEAEEPAGFVTFGFDQAIAYALVQHDLLHDRLPDRHAPPPVR